MKRQRIQFLVTCSIGYDTPAERREAIAAARENLLAVSGGRESRPVKATLVTVPRGTWHSARERRAVGL